MATKLEKALKRELELEDETYTITLGPEGVRMTRKGFRKGKVLSWQQFLETAGDE